MHSRGPQTTAALTGLPAISQLDPSPTIDLPVEPVASVAPSQSASQNRSIKHALCFLLWVLAIFQLSETTADPDLFGHVVFGQQMLSSRAVQLPETYSWTANGQAWINHEYAAELVLGGIHLLMGGSGLLLLKVLIGALAFFLCLRLGSESLKWPATAVTWVVGIIAIVEISFGFAARPQIFTALGLVLELMIVRRIHEGKKAWALALPPLFAVWFNFHGGALAGIGLLLVAAVSTTMQATLPWFRPAPGSAGVSPAKTPGLIVALWLGSIGSIVALFCNPWGPSMVRWVIDSILWLRPEIQEWNPTPLNWEHATLFILIGVSAFAWSASRRRRALWELGVTAAFAVLALRSVRNAPLFALVTLALTPPHLADAIARFRQHFEGLVEFWARPRTQELAPRLIGLAGCAIAIAAFTLHKEHPFTMEVPRTQYPTAAVSFIRNHELKGRMLTFFDWGEMIIFELPQCPVSIDGRLDTCYSRPLITEHWKLYNGELVDQAVLPVDQADLALLPSKLLGGHVLAQRSGWKPVYFDGTAVVLVRDIQRFPSLTKLKEAPTRFAPGTTRENLERAEAMATIGRAPFPNRSRR